MKTPDNSKPEKLKPTDLEIITNPFESPDNEERLKKEEEQVNKLRSRLMTRGMNLSQDWNEIFQFLTTSDNAVIIGISSRITKDFLVSHILALYGQTRSVHEKVALLRMMTELTMYNPVSEDEEAELRNLRDSLR